MTTYTKWTSAEDAILTTCLTKHGMTMKDATELLPGRSYSAVKVRASAVGLRAGAKAHMKRGAASETYQERVLAEKALPWPKVDPRPNILMQIFHGKYGYFQDRKPSKKGTAA